MPTTLPPRNGDARDDASLDPPASRVLPDEAALRTVFDATFPSLLTAARAELGAPAAGLAPKVVECVYVHAWEQRARFETMTALNTFLHEDLHHGVARALSRRAAAHRLGHHGEEEARAGHAAPHAASQAAPAAADASSATAVAAPPAEAEASWEHVLGTIHDQGPKHEVRAKAHEHMRHEAAMHVASVGKERNWWPVVVGGALALVAIFFAMRWVDGAAQESVTTRALSAPDARNATSGRGQVAVVTLGEGTKVRLAPDSRVTIPKGFGARLRAVKLDGGATFDPAEGREVGLQVHARNAVVVATGTSFSVRAYEGDPDVVVQVHTGTVSVRAAGAERALAAGEALVVAADGAMRTPDAAALEVAMGWMKNRLVVPSRPLGAMLPELRRWFALDIGVADTALAARPVALDVALDKPGDAIAAIESQAGVKYSYADKGRNLVFRAADAPGAGASKAVKPKAVRPR